jgi:hypothetical protein
MFYCSNILATIDPSCSHVWMKDTKEEEDHLTSAIKTRLLLPTKLILLLNTFMLNKSNVMEEWRNFYESAKIVSGRSKIFPTFYNYVRKKLAEVDKLLAKKKRLSCFPKVTNDVCAIVHGPLRVVTTRSAMWTQGRHFRYFVILFH